MNQRTHEQNEQKKNISQSKKNWKVKDWHQSHHSHLQLPIEVREMTCKLQIETAVQFFQACPGFPRNVTAGFRFEIKRSNGTKPLMLPMSLGLGMVIVPVS